MNIKMLAVDWSHTKGQATFDGTRVRHETIKAINGKKVKFYTKGHSHNAALNRVATFLAKEIYQQGNRHEH